MDKPSILPTARRLPSERQVKRMAKEMKRETGYQHQHCLNAIAAQHGFPNWGDMKHSMEDEDARYE